MGGHTKNFFLAVTLLLYVTGTLARGVREEFTNDEVRGDFGTLEITTLPYNTAFRVEEDLEEERRKEEEEIQKSGEGCEYDGRWYGPDESVKTHEPCLRCKCLGATLVCQLKVCPQVPDIVPQGCYRLKKSGECCEEIVCEGELENNRLYRKETELEGVQEGPEAEQESVHIKDPAAIAAVFGTRRRGTLQNVTSPTLRGCVTEGAVFAEGSAMVSPDECSYCFCIRGKQRCVAPKCLLPVEGCRPRYRSFSCCPSYYDCYDASTTTTTTRKTPRDCEYNGRRYSDGSLVQNDEAECKNCYCISGKVTCTKTKCDQHLEGCKPIMEEGRCCPVRYECEDKSDTIHADELLADSGADDFLGNLKVVKPSIANQRGAFKSTEPDWQRNMARQSPGGEVIITDTPNEESILDDTPNEPKEQPLEPQFVEETEPEELTEGKSQAERQEEQENTDKSSNLGTRTRVTQRRRLIGRITRPSSDEIENKRKQTRYPAQRIPPRIRPPRPQRPSIRPNTRIKFNKGKPKNEERKQATQSTVSKDQSFSESTTKPTATTTLKYKSTTYESDANRVNELETTVRQDTEQVTRSYSNGPAAGISDKSQESPNETNEGIQVSSERPTQGRPTRFSQHRSPFLRRRNQNQSLSSILRTRTQQRERGTSTESQDSVTSTANTTPARVLIPSSSRTTPLLTSTTEEIEPLLTLEEEENSSILPALNMTESPASLSSQEVTERPMPNSFETTIGPLSIGTDQETTQAEDDIENTYELENTTPQDVALITSRYEDTTIVYNTEHEAGLTYSFVSQDTEDISTGKSIISLNVDSTQRASTLDPLLPVDDSPGTVFPSGIITTLSTLSSSSPQSTPTTTPTILTSTMSEDVTLPEISGVGHVEIVPVDSISELSLQKPKRHFNIDKAVAVGTGVNVKGNLEDAVAFGPILIFDNRVRVDRQNREFNTTDNSETTDSENTAATEIPEETTMFSMDDVNDTDHATANGESSIDYETGTDEITTLFPTLPLAKVTTVKSLSELLSQATTEPTSTTTETLSSVSDNVEYIAADDIEGIETDFPSYDITVGTSVLATNQAKPFTSGVGEVIPVDLEPEHKSPEIESGPVIQDESPSLLGTILNILTRTERPRPERFSPQPSSDRLPPPPPPPPGRLPPPPPPPFRPPFRPRPRPDGRPDRRPDFIPPRFRPPPPPPKATERDTTEEPETSTDLSSTIPIVVPTTSQSITTPKSESTNVNRPVAGFSKPDPVVNIPIHILNTDEEIIRPDIPTRHNDEVLGRPSLPNRPDFLPNRPVAIPPRVTSSNSPAGLPSKPVIEGGFQGMKDSEGFEPDYDYEYDEYGTPTLPPSLPNLKIIPFVAADALVNQEIGIAGDDFKSPILLKETSTDNDDPENQRIPETTEATSTTTRRSFLRLPIGDRRPPILPPRRQINRPGDDSSTRRPFVPPPRRPGVTRAPFPFKTKTTASPEDGNEDTTGTEESRASPRPSVPFEERERPSTRPPFIPPRRPTQVTDETTTTTTTTVPTTTQHLQTTTTTNTTPRPIVSNDITNLLLQDVFGLTETQNTPPVRFTQDRTSPKPRFPIKTTTSLPEIPAAVRDQMPLATDPVLASGLLKLSGCNIYGRMYDVGDQIKELSSGCKECRCTHVGVQCLPAC